ncbi:hypothetical protein [Vibrio owensii]|uniref:hypothetical protein n=1 Tax=Vibrio harveyi group TaxID=717610 RepID=UPI003CC66F26
MSAKLKFDVEAIDGNFKREYDTVEEFKQKELGRYVGLNSHSMTSSDGICVYYPADDYTKQQIDFYLMAEAAKNLEDAVNINTEVVIAKGSGLGFVNLYAMQQHLKSHGNVDDYYIETDTGRFFIQKKEDNSMFRSMDQGRFFRTYAAKEEQMAEVFSNEDLGFGSKKKEGINCFLIDPSTMLIQDTTKTHTSIESIKKVKMSREKAVVATLRSKFWEGNEDTPGPTHSYSPAVVSVDKDTYTKILEAHYPESVLGDEYNMGEYDSHRWIETQVHGYVFDKDHPVNYRNVLGFDAKILKGKEAVKGEVIFVDKEFLNSMFSNDENGLTVRMDDFSTVYLELGKAYEATGSAFSRERAYAELPAGTKFKKIPEREHGLDIPF